MELSDVLKIIEPLLNFWVLVAIIGTSVLTQGFKAVLKHYTDKYAPNFDKFTRKSIIFIVAYFIGYFFTMKVLAGTPDVERFALIMGILSPTAYYVTLRWAQYKQWIDVVAALKMRKIVTETNAQGETVEKIKDDDDLTEMAVRKPDGRN